MGLQHSLVIAGPAASSLGLQDVMDRFWFQRNILSSVFPGFNIQPATVTTAGGTITGKKIKTCTLTPKLLFHSLEPVSASSSIKRELQEPKAVDKKNELQIYSNNRKSPRRLDLGIKPVSCHPRALPGGAVLSCPTLPVPTPRLLHRSYSDAKYYTRLSGHKSLSDLEKFELEGFMDLGFVFHKESLNLKLMNLVPGLQGLGDGYQGRRMEQPEKVRRPYLSEAWMINRLAIPIVKPQVLSYSPDGTGMKKQLQLWARDVASMIQQNYQLNNTGII